MQNKMKTWSILTLILLATACTDRANKTTDTPPNNTDTSSLVKKVEQKSDDGTISMLMPDFTEFVARESDAVVNITAIKHDEEQQTVNNNDLDGLPAPSDPFFNFLRRIMPHEIHIPNDNNSSQDNDGNSGAGVIISKDGYIVTNTHVIKNTHKIKVTLNDRREYIAEVVGVDEKSDVAVVKINANDLPVAKIGKSDTIRPGSWVVAIGAPFGFEHTVTKGIVSAKGRSLPGEPYTLFIQTDVAINPGNSGGPLLNLHGQVVGINSQIYSKDGSFTGISFAIPIETAMNVAEQLKTTGKVQRGQLGVIVQEVTYDLAQSFGLDKPTGALVVKVLPNSPAQQAGVQVGDIIRSVDGTPIPMSTYLPATIGNLMPDKEVILSLLRKGQEVNLTTKLSTVGDNLQTQKQKETVMPHPSNQGTSFEVPSLGLLLNSEGERLIVVRTGGVAYEAGLLRGDVIEEVGGIPVKDQASFNEALQRTGKHVSLLIKRDDDTTVFLALQQPEAK